MINHGTWSAYDPETKPSAAPPNALFWRNELGEDWYEKVSSLAGSVTTKLLVHEGRVVSVSLDASSLVPLGTLYELPSGTAIPEASDYFYGGNFHKVPENAADLAYRLYKLNFLERLSTGGAGQPDEAAMLEAALAAEEPKMRLMYNAAEYFQSDDTLFAYLHWVVAVALGSEAVPNTARADELLAPVAA